MFVGKTNLDNIRKLLKIRMRECKGIHTICILLGVVFLISIVNLINTVSTYQAEAKLIEVSLYSNFTLFFIVISVINYAFQYGEYNENHQIFPQTMVTQFISFELYCFFVNIIAQAFALGLYLLQYLICLIIGRVHTNVKLAYQFDWTFVIAGFFVYLLYGLLLSALIILIASLVRKLQWWAIVLLGAFLFVLWMTREQNLIGNMLDFYLLETSIIIFFIKSVATLLILEALNHLINYYTGIKETRKFFYRHIIIASVIILGFFINISVSFSQIDSRQNNEDYWNSISIRNFDFSKMDATCIINTDSLPTDSTLKIRYANALESDCINNVDEQPSDDNNIRIYYIPQKNINNYINLTAFTNQRIEATLETDILKISVAYDKNIKVISEYPYSTLMKFDCFIGKPYAKPYYGSMSSISTGHIQITLPENKHFTTQFNQ
jgi:hypothetical protein